MPTRVALPDEDDDLIAVQRIKLETYKFIRFPHNRYTPAFAAEMYRCHVDHCANEIAMALCLDRKLKMRQLVYAGYGDEEQGVPFGKKVLLIPHLATKRRFVLLHNHVDNNVAPSERDRQITKDVAAVAMCIGRVLVDHLIIGNDYGFTSMKELGFC